MVAQPARKSGRQLRIHEKPHLSGCVEVLGGVCDAGTDVFGFKIRKVGEYLLLRSATGEHVQNIFHAYTHTPDARASPALIRVYRNPFQDVHDRMIIEARR